MAKMMALRIPKPDMDPKKALDDVISVAATIARRSYGEDVSDALADEMKGWAIRLRNDHDAQIVVEQNGSRHTTKQRPWR